MRQTIACLVLAVLSACSSLPWSSSLSVEEEVSAVSQAWIESFNAGEIDRCIAAYSEDAVMHALPMGTFVGHDEIGPFWREFVATTGAGELVYRNVAIERLDDDRAVLSADWGMNVGRGVITRELWVRQADDSWRLEEDHFEVLEQFESSGD